MTGRLLTTRFAGTILRHLKVTACLGLVLTCMQPAVAQSVLRKIGFLPAAQDVQPAGEGTAESLYLAMELERQLLSNPEMASCSPTLERSTDTWVLKGQFNSREARRHAVEAISQLTGAMPRDKSRLAIHSASQAKPLSVTATRLLANRHLHESHPHLVGSVRCESSAPGMIQVSGTVASMEDKLALMRGLHKLKSVVAVQGDLGISPMIHNGRKVIVVNQQGDLMLEQIPVGFPVISAGSPQINTNTNTVLPATSLPVPSRGSTAPVPLPDLVPAPVKPSFFPDKIETPVKPTQPMPSPVPGTIANPLAAIPPYQLAKPESDSAQRFTTQPVAAQPAVIERVEATTQTTPRMMPAGQLNHPREVWTGPPVVTVGGKPIATAKGAGDLNQHPWQTAHQSRRETPSQTDWRVRVSGSSPTAVVRSVENGPAAASTTSLALSSIAAPVPQPRQESSLGIPPLTQPSLATPSRVATNPAPTPSPSTPPTGYGVPTLTLVHPGRPTPFRATGLVLEAGDETFGIVDKSRPLQPTPFRATGLVLETGDETFGIVDKSKAFLGVLTETRTEPKKGAIRVEGDAESLFETGATAVRPSSPTPDYTLGKLEDAVRIACVGLAHRIEVKKEGTITWVRIMANDLASERKVLESMVLLPEIHQPDVRLEVKVTR